MFDHLLTIQDDPPAAFIPLREASASQVLEAQVTTADWLDELGVPSDEEIDNRHQRTAAREAFTELALNPDADDESKKLALTNVKTPAAVRHLVGMLTEYDWEFVQQAKELRGYVVARLLEHAQDRNPKVSLQALKMLGSVTEVAAFTERVEVKNTNMSEDELNERLQAKLRAFLDGTVVADATPPALPAVDIEPMLRPKKEQ